MTGGQQRWAFPFDYHHRRRAPRQLADELGGKGANLAEMTTVLRLPVPPGFTIVTSACRAFRAGGWPAELDRQIDVALAALERQTHRGFGDPEDPLLVSVRSGARNSMPGMMDTVLNVGLTTATIDGLIHKVGARCAFDSWHRLLVTYGQLVLGLDANTLTAIEDEVCGLAGSGRRDLAISHLEKLCARVLEALEAANGPLPPARTQLRHAVEAVFCSWDSQRAVVYRRQEGIADDRGTAVNVQAMVFGNRDQQSGTGVAFSRDPSTGTQVPCGDFLPCAQGEDVVAGSTGTQDLTALRQWNPEIHAELMDMLARLEEHYTDLCDTEFTIESGQLWMLQTRVGKRTTAAAVRIAVDLAEQTGWSITREEGLCRVDAAAVDEISKGALLGGTVVGRGLAASPGAAVGEVCLAVDSAIAAANADRRVVLVRPETSPEDVHGMQVADGILTATGGLVSHAAVVAREWGIPAVVGARDLVFGDGAITIGSHRLVEGEVVCLDGTTGEIRVNARLIDSPIHLPGLDKLVAWAAEIVGEVPEASTPGELIAAAQRRLAEKASLTSGVR